MQLAPGLHRLGDGLVNSYLVEDGGAITIVDAGMSGQYGDLERELAAMGRSKADIRAIVLTHGDTDHVGFADRLRQELGIPVYVGAADVARARGEVKKPGSGWGPMKPGPMIGFMALRAAQGRPAHEAGHGADTRLAATRRWTCRDRRASSRCRGTRRAARPCTCRRSARCSSATR